MTDYPTTLVQLQKGSEPVPFDLLPVSLREAFVAQAESLERYRKDIEATRAECSDLTERIKLSKELGLNTNGLKGLRTRRQSHIRKLERTCTALEAGYLELPDFGWATSLDAELPGWNPIAGAPLRVLKALKAAKESGLFEDIVVHTDASGDPVIVGLISAKDRENRSKYARFYVAAWR